MKIQCPDCGHKGEPEEMVLELLSNIYETYVIDEFTEDGTPVPGNLVDYDSNNSSRVAGYECRYCGLILLEGGRGSGTLQELENLYSIKHET